MSLYQLGMDPALGWLHQWCLGEFLPPGSPLWLWGQVGGSGTRWDMAVRPCCGWWDLVECDHESRWMWWDPVGCGHRFMLGVVGCGCGSCGMWWDTVGPSCGFILVVGGMWLWVWQDVVGCIHGPAADTAVAAPCSDPSPAGAAASPGVPKGAVAPGAGSNGAGGAGGALGCPLPPATRPVAFLGQEQALALGGSLPPGLFLGTLPFLVALGQHPPACGGNPEGPSLPSLLAASLLLLPLLPLGIPQPGVDLLPLLGTLLSTLLPLSPGPGERGPEAPVPSPKGCVVLPDWPLLFVLPTSLALHPTLLAAGLGSLEPAPAAPPVRPAPLLSGNRGVATG